MMVEIEWDAGGDEVYRFKVPIVYTPGRSAPRCSNPDAAAFSDPGEGSSWHLDAIAALEATCRADQAAEIIGLPKFKELVQDAADRRYEELRRY